MKKIIVFDLDGVLFDSIDAIEKNMLDMYPGFTKEIFQKLACGNFHEEIKKVSISKKIETKEEEAKRKLLYSKNKSTIPMYIGSKELLKGLHQSGYILALNTSSYNHACLPLLERSNVISLFDFIATAEVSTSKVEKFKIIKEKYDLNNEDCLFITDTLGDIKEADIANIPTVAVTWGQHDRSYFTREKHKNLIKIVDSFEELKDFIFNS
ncbi:HAD family hydrolase [Candidatus Pacearchaeota archaeon]|nr:HAD family hydrolase [Candidatus Pacearchaeota archaeon]